MVESIASIVESSNSRLMAHPDMNSAIALVLFPVVVDLWGTRN